ncbi:MAG: PASTA domain-containing protein [Saprospiraceae bacterium]|nr:PASTA domain-containing protein [Saprospiraceae bacterium]
MSAPQANLSSRLKSWWNAFLHFISSALFINNLIALIGATLFLILFVSWWLNCYTHHGQKLTIKNYVGIMHTEAAEDAEDHSFQLIVEDSIFIVGKPGGIILAQNPVAGSKVKEERKIYVTITKQQADEIPFASLPMMYGKEINVIRKLLKQQYQINCEILSERYDQGPPNVILEVIYNGDTLINARRKTPKNIMVSKGSTIQVVISKDVSESVQMPDLTCQPLPEADFLLNANRLVLGEMHLDETVTNRYSAFVIRQDPAYVPGKILTKGDTISVWLTQAKPARCPESIPGGGMDED